MKCDHKAFSFNYTIVHIQDLIPYECCLSQVLSLSPISDHNYDKFVSPSRKWILAILQVNYILKVCLSHLKFHWGITFWCSFVFWNITFVKIPNQWLPVHFWSYSFILSPKDVHWLWIIFCGTINSQVAILSNSVRVASQPLLAQDRWEHQRYLVKQRNHVPAWTIMSC